MNKIVFIRAKKTILKISKTGKFKVVFLAVIGTILFIFPGSIMGIVYCCCTCKYACVPIFIFQFCHIPMPVLNSVSDSVVSKI